jgi:hypothetical protein
VYVIRQQDNCEEIERRSPAFEFKRPVQALSAKLGRQYRPSIERHSREEVSATRDVIPSVVGHLTDPEPRLDRPRQRASSGLEDSTRPTKTRLHRLNKNSRLFVSTQSKSCKLSRTEGADLTHPSAFFCSSGEGGRDHVAR